MNASATVDTLLEAMIAPPARPFACIAGPKTMSSAASATFSLPAVAVSCEACVAVTARFPATSSAVSRT